MSVTGVIRALIGTGGTRGELAESEAHELVAAMLDGGVAELELGAVLALLEQKRRTLAELLGFSSALAQRCFRLKAPAAPARPAVFASYHGVRDQPNLLPLLVLALHRLGVPVLVHGTLEGAGGVASAYVFRELGVMPCSSLAQAQAQLDEGKPVFAPTAVLAPGLAELLALRGRLGLCAFAMMLAKLLAPFDGDALHIVAADDGEDRALLQELLSLKAMRALLLEGTEGEPFADPRRRPRLEYVAAGESSVLFDAETTALRHAATLPHAVDAHSTAAWIRRALSGEAPLPLPLVNQIACCLYAAGCTEDMNQAKAIVAVETGSLAAA